MKTAAIMQPTYIPWMGYFDLIDQCDIFVFLDNVQLVKRSWQVRNRIKAPKGELYLTIPIKKTKLRDELILCEAVMSQEEAWQAKHCRSIELAYKNAPYFNEVFPFLKDALLSGETRLSTFTAGIIRGIASRLGLDKECILASSLEGVSGKKDQLLVSICKRLGIQTYLSPQGSAEYIEKDCPGGEFSKNSIALVYHNYEHPCYSQLYGDFIPFLSIADLLFNHGFSESLAVIRSGRRKSIDYATFREKHPLLHS